MHRLQSNFQDGSIITKIVCELRAEEFKMDQESDSYTNDSSYSEVHNCNPTLPNEMKQDDVDKMKGDAIGDTLYSERWVLKTLMKFTQEYGKYCQDEVMELEDELEADLCLLWDMTIERDVDKVLMDHNILQLITEVVRESSSPRLTEIMVGMLGNLACQKSIREEITKIEDLVKLLVGLLRIPDSPCLIQLVRLLHTCVWDVRHEEEWKRSIWIDTLKDNSDFAKNVAFILSSSTNEDLICCTCEFMDTLLFIKLEDGSLFGKHFANPDLVHSLLVALEQLHSKYEDDGEEGYAGSRKVRDSEHHWVSILYNFTFHTEGKAALEEHAEAVVHKMNRLVFPFTKKHALRQLGEENSEFLTCILTILEMLSNVAFHRHTFVNLVKTLSELSDESKDDPSEKGGNTNGESTSAGPELKDNKTKNNKQDVLESLQDYCISILKVECNLDKVFSALNQCHSFQIRTFCEAIQVKDSEILQHVHAVLENSDKYNRLKSIFNDCLNVT